MTSLKYLLTLLLVFFGVSITHAQYRGFGNTNPYWEGEIKQTNGEIIEGIIKVPETSRPHKIVYKTDENGKKEKIKTKKVDAIYLTSSIGKQYLFERLDVYNVINQKRAYGKKDLLLVVRKNDYTTLYARHGTYKINPEKDEIVLIYYYLFGRDTPTLFYYLRKNLVEHAYLLNATNQVGNFRRRMAFHLNEVPELVEKINNKELKMKDIDDVIDIYFNKTEDM